MKYRVKIEEFEEKTRDVPMSYDKVTYYTHNTERVYEQIFYDLDLEDLIAYINKIKKED